MHDAHAIPEVPTHQEVVRDVMGRFEHISQRYWSWVTLLAVLSVLGVVGFWIRLSDGFDDRSNWGYTVATLSFLLSTFMAMPILSAGLRLAKAHWRRPITRVTENMAITGIVVMLLLIPAVAALPDINGRLTIWFEFPLGAPTVWDFMGFGTLALLGLMFLWALALPDLATARDHLPPSKRRSLIRTLALGWTGNTRQWRVLHMGILTLGGFYLLFYPLVQTLMVSEFHAGLLPGLKDAIAPATAVVTALQAGTGMTLVVMFLMRRFGGYENYFTVDQFWALSKPLLAFSLLWFYFWWASFITFWYGRQPGETALLKLLVLDSYRIPLMLSFFLNFLGPLIALVWNPVRRSIWGPALVATGIVIGAFINHVRLYVSAFSVEDPFQIPRVLSPIPARQLPEAPDVLIIVGAISSCVLLFMLVSKIIPAVSIWEVAEGLRLTKVRRYLGRYVRVIAKSH
jgi:hypothetical protein